MMQSVSSQKSEMASIARCESFAVMEKEISEELSILDLPTEVTYQIFTYLDIRTLIMIVALVCKPWRDLVRGDCLWRYFRYLSLEENEILPQLLQLIGKCLCLRHLKIRAKSTILARQNLCPCYRIGPKDCYLMGNPIFSAISRIRNLESFYLTGFLVDSTCKHMLGKFLKYSPKLTSLNLSFCEISEVCETLSEAKNVKFLNLAGYRTIQIQTLTEVIEKLNHLEQIDLSHQSQLEESDINPILQFRSETITSLTLRNIELNDSAFVYIENCLHLSVLKISCARLTDIILPRLQKLPLQELELSSGSNFSQSVLKEFCEQGSISQLKYLKVGDCDKFGNSALKVVADRCPNLLALDVAFTQVTDEGICHIIRKCPKLMLLKLCGLKINGYFLRDIKIHLKFLKVLDLGLAFDMDVTFINNFITPHPVFKVITDDLELLYEYCADWEDVMKPDFEPLFDISQEL